MTMTRRTEAGGVAGGVRRHNLGLVLEHVHLMGDTSRSELASTTGLNRSTIGDLVGQLTALGLVVEDTGNSGPRPGRPSLLVSIRPEGACALAIEIEVDSVAVATIGLGGRVFGLVRVDRTSGRSSPEATVRRVIELARPLLSALPDAGRLVGAGVAVAGIARHPDGLVRLAPNLGWRDVPLGAMVAEALEVDIPVQVGNEADFGAYAEHRRGAHSGTAHLIYLSGEVGIGAGVIINGEPLRGAEGYAGEAGHTLINPEGRRCRCGATGCWETEAGETALLRRSPQLEGHRGARLVEAIRRQVEAGDRTTIDALAEVGRWLGLGIGNLVNVFNPDVVVLGGSYAGLYPYLEESVEVGATQSALADALESVSIARSTLGSDASLVGAAEIALAETLADPARLSA